MKIELMLFKKIGFIILAAGLLPVLFSTGCQHNPKTPGVIAAPVEKLPEKASTAPVADSAIAVIGKANAITPAPVPAPLPLRINASRIIVPESAVSQFLGNDCFITRWNFLGPFPYPPEQSSGVIHLPLMPDEKLLSGDEKPDNRNAYWQLMRFNSGQTPGRIDLRRIYKDNIRYAVAYAVTFIQSDTPLNNLVLLAGSSDNIKIWLNHKLVHTYDLGPRKTELDQDSVRGIKLNAGYNLIVVKTINTGSDDWDFILRFATSDNSLLKFEADKE